MEAWKDDAIIIPRRGKHEKPLPPTGIVLINSKEAALGHALVVDLGGEMRGFPHSKLSVNANRYCVAGPAVGAPIAAMVVEKLIALGVERVFMLSWCGALSPDLKIGDVVIGGMPLSGEGTSQYYQTGVPPAPSGRLSQMLLQWASDQGLTPVSGRIWSTDAPYRESRALLQKLWRDDNVLGIDMEYSALCSVCTFRSIEFAALFLVSDELLGEKWKPGFKDLHFQEINKRLTQALVSEDIFAVV
jgi:uridine phosphorylase